MELPAELSLLEQLGEVIGSLTTSGNPSLNIDLLKKLKNICKKSDVYIKHAYHLILTQLKKNHAEIRLSSFQIINEFFLRSHAFREMLLIDFQIFLELTLETDYKQPLPPPASAAKILKEKALEAVDSWHRKFGSHYKKLDLGYSFLKKVKNVELSDHVARSQAESRQVEERERRKRNIINGQVIRVENEMSEMISEMELCATEIENCFKLLLPHPDEYEVHCVEETAVSELEQITDTSKSQDATEISENLNGNQIPDSREEEKITDQSQERDAKVDTDEELVTDHGLGTRSYQLTIRLDKTGPEIRETVDNSIVLNTAREFYKEMTHKHLPMINKWISVLTKGEGTQQKIQELIDLKRTLEMAKTKFLELKITPLPDTKNSQSTSTESSSDEDDDTENFEDVPEREDIEFLVPPSQTAGKDPKPSTSTHKTFTESRSKISGKNDASLLKKFGANLQELGDPTSRATALFKVRNKLSNTDSFSVPVANSKKPIDERKKRLLEKAPVVPFDMDLYFWEDPSAESHKIVKMYLDNNWASKEHEGEYLVGDEKEARPTRMVTFAGNFEPVKWSCRAPLPSGKLCPRRDRVKCPLHGKIIRRDETGSPTSHSNAASDATTETSERNSRSVNAEEDEGSSTVDWKEIQVEVEAATGLDLGGKNKRKRKSHSKASGKEESGLTDIKKQKNTVRNRLGKIVMNKKAMRRVADQMDAIATKRCEEKFANQFNYSLRK